MKRLVLRGGRVIDPAGNGDRVADLLLVDGRIAAFEPGGVGAVADAQIIDCAGWWVMPGLIDPHVHLRDPGFPQKETIASGLSAAAAGGFTTVAAMANTAPVNDAPAITHYMLEQARQVRAARLVPVSAVTRNLAGRELVDVVAMVDAGARLFSDDGIPIDNAELLQAAFHAVARLDHAISLHEEDRALTAEGAINAGAVAERLGLAGIPPSAESARVRRDLALARDAGAAVHIAHISTVEAVELVRAARDGGLAVTCEAAPHHFTLDDRAVLEFGVDAKMSPPLRAAHDRDALRAGLADGTIDMIATDHAPHDPASKKFDRLGPLFHPGRVAERLSPEDARTMATRGQRDRRARNRARARARAGASGCNYARPHGRTDGGESGALASSSARGHPCDGRACGCHRDRSGPSMDRRPGHVPLAQPQHAVHRNET